MNEPYLQEFSFEIDVYRKLPNSDARFSYFISAAHSLEKIDIQQLSKDDYALQMLREFITAVQDVQEVALADFGIEIFHAFTSVTKLVGLENGDKFMRFSQCIFNYISKQSEYDESVTETLDVLFNNDEFCYEFMLIHELERVIILFYESKKINFLAKLISHIKTNCLISKFVSLESANELQRILCYITHLNNDSNYIFEILTFLFQIIPVLFTNNKNIIKILNYDNVFEKINYLICNLPIDKIFGIYKFALHCSEDQDQIPIHPIILNALAKLYQIVPNEVKEGILNIISVQNSIFKDEFCISESYFSLEKWFCGAICEDSKLLTKFSTIISLCFKISKFSITSAIHKIIDYISPIFKEKVIYSEIFTFFINLIINKKIEKDIFDDDYFLDKIFIKSTLKDISNCIDSYPSFNQLITYLFSKNRTKWHSQNILNCIIELIYFNESMKNYFCALIRNNYTPGILRFFFDNFLDEKYRKIFEETLQYEAFDIVQYFLVSDCFYPIEKNINEIEKFYKPLLKFISKVTLFYHVYFFDDWVLKQPKESPLFLLNGENVKKYIYSKNNILLIPSLLCLCNPIITTELINLNLISKYSLPVLLKLNLPIEKLPSLKNALQNYVPPQYIGEIIEKHLKFLISINSIIEENCKNLYLFLPGVQSYLTSKDNLRSSLVFSIKFIQSFPEKYPFVSFNGNHLYILKDQIIFDNVPIYTVDFNAWNKIFLLSEKGKIFTFINNIQMSNVINDQNSVLFESFGSKLIKPSVPFYIMALAKTFDFSAKTDEIINKTEIKFDSVGAFLIDFLPLSKIYEDFEKITILFAMIEKETNEEQLENMVILICKIIDFRKDGLFEIVNNFIYILKLKFSYVKSSWLINFYQSILNVNDINDRTKLFKLIFYDMELWSIINQEILYETMKSIINFLSNKKYNLIYEELCESGIFRFMFYLISFFQTNDSLFSIFESFMMVLIQNIKNPLLFQPIADIVKYANIWTFNKNENEITNLFLSFSNESKVQELFTNLLFEIEKQNVKVFSFDTLLYLSIYLPKETGYKCFKKVLNNYEDSKYIPSICFASKRYGNIIELYQFIMMNINENRHRDLYVPMLLTISISMWRTTVNFNLQNIQIGLAHPKFLLKPNIFPYFIEFLQTGASNFDGISINQNIFKDLPVNHQRFWTQKNTETFSKINKVYPEFLQKVQKYNDKYLLKSPYLPSFIKYISIFIANCLFVKVRNTAFMKEIFSSVIIFSNHEILIGIMKECLYRSKDSNVPNKTLKLFIEILIISSSKNNKIIQDNDVFENLLACYDAHQKLYPEFYKLIVTCFDYFTELEQKKSIDLLIKILPKYIDSKSKEIQYIYYHVLKNNLIQKNQILDDFIKNIAQILHNKLSKNISVEIKGFQNDIQNQKLIEVLENILITYKTNVLSSSDIKSDYVISSIYSKEHIKFLFLLSSFYAFMCKFSIDNFNSSMEQFLILKEKTVSHFYQIHLKSKSQIQNEINAKSYYVSPFALSCTCPAVIFPSSFHIYTPNEVKEPISEISGDFNYFGIIPSDVIKFPNKFPSYLFQYTTMLSLHKNEYKNILLSLYPNIIEFYNCRLILSFSGVKSVFIKTKENVQFLLLDAKLEDDKLELLDLRYDTKISIYESILSNEFGNFSFFYGHFIIKLEQKDFYRVKKYISTGIPSSILYSSFSQGNFILQFKENYQNLSNIVECFSKPIASFDLEKVKESWINCKISNFEYINILNFYANRSFAELSSYPIAPVILRRLNDEEFTMENNIRPLDTPIDVVADNDPNHLQIRNRFKIQKFHHAENISNSMHISSMFSRFTPFCRYQWKVNEGWDKGERNFLSIPKFLSIHSSTHYEITPEFFCFPEIFLNLNNFTLPGGKSFELDLPKWANNVFNFVEKYSYALELPIVRKQIHNWFDLTFGCKLNGKYGEEALNLYQQLSYISFDISEQDIEQKHQWVKTCGAVPFQLFNEPHPPSIERGKFDISSLIYIICLNQHPNTNKEIPKEILVDSIHTSFSQNNHFVVITYMISKVIVYNLDDRKIQPQMSLNRYHVRFSFVFEKQLMCVTCCNNEIVIWSISNGAITTIIPIPNVNAMLIKEDINSIFMSSENILYHYTINGFLVRKIDLSQEITALSCFENGFSIFDKYILIGHRDGTIKICSIDFNSCEFIIIDEKIISNCPIINFSVDLDLYEVSVYDLRSCLNYES